MSDPYSATAQANPDLQCFASIIPLNYSKDRVEHSLLYCSTNWEELVLLLADPVAFFKARQDDFKQSIDPPRDWSLLSPVTVILQPGARFRPNVSRLEAMFARKEQDPSFAKEPKDMLAMAFKTGAFFAEFALCTKILFIHYWPPKPLADGPRFKKTLTPATFGLVPGPNKKLIGTLHFDLDIEDNEALTKEDHAKLVVDCLESRKHIVKSFNERADFEIGVIGLTPMKGTISVRDKADLIPTGNTEDKTRFALKEIGRKMVVPRDKFDLPTIVVDGLSRIDEETGNTVDGILCCNVPVYDDGEVIHMHDMVFKTYMTQQEKDKDCPGNGPVNPPGHP